MFERMKELNRGDLKVHQWTIKRDVWDEKLVNAIFFMLSKLKKDSDGARYTVSGGNNCLLIPEEFMTKKVP